MSQFILNIDGSVEQDKVFICDRSLNTQGELYPIEDLHTVMRLNQNDEVNFKIYKNNNGETNPFWDKVDDIQIILVEGKGYFEIATPLTVEECVYKQVTGISLGEAETSQTNVTLEINTEDDIARNDYIPTILYNQNTTEGSLLHRLFQSMPHYTIGHVDASVACIQKTFSCENETVYDFLQTVAEENECIFIFDNFKREVNCYDLKDHCNRQSCITAGDYRNVKDGVCQHCNSSDYITYGYGKDTGVFIDNQNLVESVTLTGDKDSVKNCLKIEGADDEITNLLGTRLMDGNYMWMFSEYQKSQMSIELQSALIDHSLVVASYQDEYNRLWDNYSECVDKSLYYQSGMMPSMETSETTARTVYNELFGAGGKITYACKSSQSQTDESILRSIKTFAKQIIPNTYDIELTLNSSSGISISFSAHVFLKDAYKEDANQNDEYTSSVSLSVKDGWRVYYNNSEDNPVFTTDYFMYLKQQLEISLEKSDAADDVISFEPQVSASYDEENDPQNLSPIHYTKYCYNRLKSFRDAYESCSQIIAKHSEQISSDISGILKYINSSGNQVSIYDDLLKKYYDRIVILDERMAYLESKINSLNEATDAYKNRIEEIKDICRMEDFLKNYNNGSYGDSLWIELCSFKREDIYRNDNYIGEDVDYATLTENVEGLIKRATEELEKACGISYSISTTIGNLLTMQEFEPLWDDFTLGNWIRTRIDEDIYRLRLISVTFDYSDLSHISVEFSDITKSNNPMVDLKSLFQQASSMATNFNSVTRQAEKGYMTNQEFAIMKEAGLNVANTMITNADNQDFLINQYGLTGRVWDDIKNAYGDEQIRIINNLLCFTSDAWAHTRLALGKIYFYNDETGQWEWSYGLNAEVLISRLIMSELLKIYNKSGTYIIDDNGFIITCNDNKIEINAKTPSFTISKIINGQEHIYMHYSPTDGLIIDGTGKFSGMVLIGSETGKYIKLDPANPSMVINNGTENIFDFNSDGSGALTITAGIITSILKSKDYKKYLSGMCIDLQNKSIEIYSENNNGEELLSYNLDNNKLFRVGGWIVGKNMLYSQSTNGIIYLGSDDMKIISILYGNNIRDSYCIVINNGKISFGLHDKNTNKFFSDYGYTDISQTGIYAKSEAGMSKSDKSYLFRVDTLNDRVSISNHSDTEPALSIKNYGLGDTLYLENTATGLSNKALHAKVFTGDGGDHFLSLFGEASYNRIVLRCDEGDGDIDHRTPCEHSALGTDIYRWNWIYGNTITGKDIINDSDLKMKNVIGNIDKEKALQFILSLQPISYTYKDSEANRIHMGFGAQTVAETAKSLDMGDLSLYVAKVVDEIGDEGYYQEDVDEDKLQWGLKYNEFVAPMTASIQVLYEMLTEQKKEILEKDTKIKQLEEQVKELSDKFEKLEEILQKHGLS